MSSFPKAMIDHVRKSKPQDLGQQIVSAGRAKMLTEGWHDVRLARLDRTKLSENELTLIWANEDGHENVNYVYPWSQDRKTGAWDFDWKFLQLLAALIPSTEAYEAFFAEVAAERAAVLDLFIGMHARVEIKRTKGRGPMQSRPEGGYQVCDVLSGEVLATGPTVEAVEKVCAEYKIYKSKYKVWSYAANAGEENVKKFALSLEALRHPAPAAAPKFPFPPKKVAPDGIPF